MDHRRAALSLLAIIVIASGCTGGGDGSTQVEGEGSITVTELSVVPSKIYSGDSVRITLEAYNTGKLDAYAMVGDYGRDMIRNYCPDLFTLDRSDYSISTSRTTEEGKSKYLIGPGEKMRVQWKLQQQGKVPIYGYKCPNMEFVIPFDYSVTAYRQIQVKEDRSIEGSPGLQSESSQGPMMFSIDTLPGVTGKANTFIPEDGEMTVTMNLVNQDPEDDDYTKGVVAVDKQSLRISASSPLKLNESFVISSELSGSEKDEDYRHMINGLEYYWVAHGYDQPRCDVPEGRITMVGGKSATISCDIPVPENIDVSEIAEISASVDYTYVKDAGSRTVRVENRG